MNRSCVKFLAAAIVAVSFVGSVSASETTRDNPGPRRVVTNPKDASELQKLATGKLGVATIVKAGGKIAYRVGYKDAGNAISESSDAMAAAAFFGTLVDCNSYVAAGVDVALQGLTYGLSDNETIQSAGTWVPGSDSKDGRYAYRLATSVLVAALIAKAAPKDGRFSAFGAN